MMKLLKSLALCAMSLLLGNAAIAAPLPNIAAPPPNIVLLIADDLGYGDVNAFNLPTPNRTPNIDRLAAEGVKFTNFYAAPLCTPSRAAMLTGRLQKRDGYGPVFTPPSTDGIDADVTTIPEMLKVAGYTTGLFGKWHLGNRRPYTPIENGGFDEFFGMDHGGGNNMPAPLRFQRNLTVLSESPALKDLGPRFAAEAVAFINRNKARPFFLEVALTAPHTPLYASYQAVVEGMDQSVGKVMKALRDAGIDQNTVVVFTSDNGPVPSVGGNCGPLSGGKNGVRECGIKVPFAARWPGHIPAGRIVAASAMNIDLFPTFAKLAGLPIVNRSGSLDDIDGKDLSPLLLNTGALPARELLFYHKYVLRAARIGKWKVMFTETGTASQLYDLSLDPGETRNLAGIQVAMFKFLAARAKQLDAAIPVSHQRKS